MPYPLPLTRTEAYLAYKAGVIQQSDLKPSLAVPRNGIDAWLAYWTGLAADYPKRGNGTPHILQEEEAYIAYLCGVVNEYPEKCLRRVGAYLRYLISARWGRPDRPLNREELYLSLIKTQFIPSGDPSSDITIEGTCKAPFVDVKMYGDTFQQTYTGKNLLNISRNAIHGNETSGTMVSTNTLRVTNLVAGAYHYYFIPLPDTSAVLGRTITLSVDVTLHNATSSQLSFMWANTWYTTGVGTPLNLTSSGTYTLTIDVPASIPSGSTRLTVGLYSSGTTSSPVNSYVEFSNVQVEIGSSKTSYEPYVGAQPSPNPDYPQQIQTVTGEQTVEIVGKNLIDPDGLELGNIDASGNDSFVRSVVRSGYIRVAAGSYTLKVNNSENNINIWRYAIYDNSKTFISANTPQAKSAAITIANNGYIRVSFYNAPWKDLTVQEIIGSQVQLELGSTASSYTPYSKQTLPIDLGSIELCKLGNYQDYIWKDGDDWKVHREIGKVTLDGSETWTRATANSGYRFWTSKAADIKTSVDAVLKANRLGVAQGDTWEYDGISGSYSTNPIRLFIRDAMFNDMTVGQLQAWLATHNIIAYYALATPTDTTITDTNLIAQLEALVNGGAEDGTTYIKVKANDPNLPGLLYVEAPKYE